MISIFNAIFFSFSCNNSCNLKVVSTTEKVNLDIQQTIRKNSVIIDLVNHLNPNPGAKINPHHPRYHIITDFILTFFFMKSSIEEEFFLSENAIKLRKLSRTRYLLCCPVSFGKIKIFIHAQKWRLDVKIFCL